MDVLDQLIADHRKAESLVDGLIGSQPGSDRETRLAELEDTLSMHIAMEERYLDPLVLRHVRLPQQQTGLGHRHHRTREALAQLRQLVADPGFAAAADALKADLRSHVSESENVVFPQLREKAQPAIAALGEPEQAAAEIRAELMTRSELEAAARRSGVDGWYDMSEQDLRESFIEAAISASDDIQKELAGED